MYRDISISNTDIYFKTDISNASSAISVLFLMEISVFLLYIYIYSLNTDICISNRYIYILALMEISLLKHIYLYYSKTLCLYFPFLWNIFSGMSDGWQNISPLKYLLTKLLCV